MKKVLLALLFTPMTALSFTKIGHRGACGYEPENTLVSFAKAIELGVDMIELDVQVCASGELVVMHDMKVDRTTNGKGYVADLTLYELKKLDAGNGESIPTLEEVCDLVNRRVIINVELKGPGTAVPTAQLIKEYVASKGWQYSDFVVSSFSHLFIVEFKRLVPEVLTGALIEGVPLSLAEFATKAGADFVGQIQDFVTEDFIDDAHARGLQLFIFTVNDFDDIERMKSLGADGIFSNYPDRI